MQEKERVGLAVAVQFAAAGNVETHMKIKGQRLRVFFVDVDFFYIFLLFRKVNQPSAAAVFEKFRVDEQHFDFVIGKADKGT